MRLSELLECERRVWRGEPVEASLPALGSCAVESQICILRILHGRHLLGIDVVLPAWRAMDIDNEVRLACVQLELAMRPDAYCDDPSPLTREALMRTQARDVRPEAFDALVRLCLSKGELRFHQHALALLDQQAARVDPSTLSPWFEALLDTPLAPLAVDRLVAVGARVPAYAALQGHHRAVAAIQAHGMQEDRALLLRLAGDDSLHDTLRLTAFAALGTCALREDLDTLLGVALQNPARLASAGFAALVSLRHRGIFLQAAHLKGVFELARYAPAPLAELTAHLSTERRQLLDGIDPEDVRWLVWLLAFDVPEHGLAPVLANLLDSATRGIRAMALELLKHPLGDDESAKRVVERKVLGLRRSHPVLSRAVLEVHGGESTCEVLLRELDEGRLEEVWFPVLVGLLPDGDERLDDLEASLTADSLHTERLWNVPRGAGRGMVRLAPGMEATRLFVRLCAAGSLTVVPALLRLLREHTHALCGGEPRHSSRPVLSARVSGAIEGLATAVHRRGGLAPRIGLCRDWDVPVAFRRWLLAEALEELDAADGRAILVRSIPLDGLPAFKLVEWSRTDDPELKRDVLHRMGEHPDVVTLGAYAVRAMSETDARVVRAGALAAIEMRCSAAVPALARLLGHPRMELKRVAARGLAVLGDGRVVGDLVDWLGRHDNAGFRTELLTALRALAPFGARGLLVAAHRREKGRTAGLLEAAIASMDQPESTDSRPSGAEYSSRTPLLFRAHAFAEEPCGRHFDALLNEPLQRLSDEAESVMLGLLPALFRILVEPAPTERNAREIRGRAAKHVLDWSALHSHTEERGRRLEFLRRIPTLPIGRARWDALRSAGAVCTLQDLKAVMHDCEATATRGVSMRSILEETGLETAAIHDVVSASAEDRSRLLDTLFAQRPVSSPEQQSDVAWPTSPSFAAPTVRVEEAIEAGARPPEDWPWAPDAWPAIAGLGGKRRPTSHGRILEVLSEQTLDDGAATVPARAAGSHLGRVPPRQRTLDDLLPEVVVAASGEKTLAAALELLSVPGDERRGLRALERFPGPVAALAVRPFLGHRTLRAAALRCFRRVASRPEVIEVLGDMLTDRDDEWVRSCARTLGFMGDPGSARVFCQLLEHRSAGVRRVARDALMLVPESAVVELHRSLRRARPDRRAELRTLLEQLRGESL